MIAYDKKMLNNLISIDHAKYFKRCGVIDAADLTAIGKSKAPAYHRTNIFIRVGVLFLTLLLAFSSCGLLILFAGFDSFFEAFKIALLVFSGITILVLEHFIKSKNHYATGVDDGLLYFAFFAFALFAGLSISPDSNFQFVVLYSLLTVFSFAAFIRYTDALAALVSFGSFLAMCFYIVLLTGTISKLIMPFAIFIISLFAYLNIHTKSSLFKCRFYIKGMEWLQWASLLSLYFSVNYFVVREAGVDFFSMILKPGEEIPLYFLFYFLTLTIPLVYVFFGIKNKDSIRLNCGLILIAVSIATIRYYHQLMPIETAFILSGIVLLAIAALLFSYLKTPRHGFTLAADKSNRNWFSKDAEAILIAQSMAHQHPQNVTDQAMGGGKFGGGGAGESF